MEPRYPTAAHSVSPYLLIALNTIKETSLSSYDNFSYLTSELDYKISSIGPSMVPAVISWINYENKSSDASYIQPRSSQSLIE